MPSITSYGLVQLSPIGPMAEISYPPARRAFSSIQTRRSKGSGRFSERWSTLPREAMVLPVGQALGIDGMHEVDHALAGLDQRADVAVLARAVRDHDDVAAADHLAEVAAQPLRQVRHLVLHEGAVGAEHALHV